MESKDKLIIGQHKYPFEDSYKTKIDDMIRIENKKRNDCPVHLKSSTHERLMRRKKTGSQTFDSVIVELLDENVELKRKLRTRKGAKDDTKTAADQVQSE